MTERKARSGHGLALTGVHARLLRPLLVRSEALEL
jgi:hypothetical protein